MIQSNVLMEKRYCIGNWKSNKTLEEAQQWIEEFISLIKKNPLPQETTSEIILCAAYHHLPLLKKEILQSNIPLKLGAQTISTFPDGPYTGEVSAQSLRGLIEYCIVGHSERRRYFHETDEMINTKSIELQKYGITPVLCVENDHTPIPSGIKIIAYEPPTAIGSGIPADPESANTVAKTIRQHSSDSAILYGGSVTKDNASLFTKQSDIDGLLIGSKSLDAKEFYQLLYATASS